MVLILLAAMVVGGDAELHRSMMVHLKTSQRVRHSLKEDVLQLVLSFMPPPARLPQI